MYPSYYQQKPLILHMMAFGRLARHLPKSIYMHMLNHTQHYNINGQSKKFG